MAPKKRKDSASESETNPRKKDKKEDKNEDKGEDKDKKMTQIQECFDMIRDQITTLNQSLLTIADIATSADDLKSKLESGDLVPTWRVKRPDLIEKNYYQKKDDCWAHAFSRGLSARMKLDGRFHNLPTANKLIGQIDKRFLTEMKGLPNAMDAASSIRRNYGYQMIVHTRPSMKYPGELKRFEKFIERLAAECPLAVCFPYLPSYARFDPGYKSKRVFRPNANDFLARRVEDLDGHCSVITGSGAVLIGNEYVEVWEMHETRGASFADDGFTRLERHQGIIKEVYEFQAVLAPVQ